MDKIANLDHYSAHWKMINEDLAKQARKQLIDSEWKDKDLIKNCMSKAILIITSAKDHSLQRELWSVWSIEFCTDTNGIKFLHELKSSLEFEGYYL